jgi:Fungal N-terminal domain of STAND proteins
MDPITAIGLISSIANMATLCRDVFIGLVDSYRLVKSAPAQSKELREELMVLSDVLQELERNMGAMTTYLVHGRSAVSLQISLDQCNQMLLEMDRRLTVTKADITKRIKWPFTQKENEEYLRRMERYKSTFTLAFSCLQT